MDVEILRKKFERLYSKVVVNEGAEEHQANRYAHIEHIRNGILNNQDVSAHTIDFTEEVKRLRNQNEERGYLDHSHHDNSHNNTRILRHLNDSHLDVNETAENLKLLEYRSRSGFKRK